MRLPAISLVCLAIAGCTPATQQSQVNAPIKIAASVTSVKLTEIYSGYWEESLKRNPLRATQIGDARFNDQLIDSQSASYRAEEERSNAAWQSKIDAIDASALSPAERLSFDMFRYNLARQRAGFRFPSWQMPMNQFRSSAQQFVILGSGQGAQPFKTAQDYRNWVARGKKIPGNFDTAIANMKLGMQNGTVQPKVLMTKFVAQLDAIIKSQAEETLFWRPITTLPDSISAAEREQLTGEFRSLINTDILPAYRKLRAFVADEYVPACRDSVSWSALPDGKAWYAQLVQQQTTTDLSAAQIHQIGLDEVARIQSEMRQLAKAQGIAGDLPEIFNHYQTDKRFEFPTEAALLEAYNGFRTRVEQGVPKLFRLVPKAPFEIRLVEAFRAQSAAGGQYNGPSMDGTRPGIFYVNTYDLPGRKTWDMESLFLHEAIPGHHFQIALQQELQALPMFRRFGGETAFSEGWGLYAESLGKELGVYTDPDQYFGRLQAELWRAIRLVVDTGLHDKNWSRQDVIDYMLRNSATNLTEATSETERYIAVPGQALAYKIGELKILALRRRAETELGAQFDAREFHAAILEDGSLPLPVLEAKITRWLAAQAKP